MGDLVEFTTYPRHQQIFYDATSGAIRFEVKGGGNAAIGLTRSIRQTCDYWVFLGNRGRTWILKECKYAHSVASPDIISAEEYHEFWIQFHSNVLCVGRGEETDPFIVYKDNMLGIKYITFGVVGEHSSITWKVELPPVTTTKTIKPITGGKPIWKSTASGQLPDNAFIGGYEKEHLYIIRAYHQNSLTPGKFVPSQGLGYISWGGEMHEKEQFQVLCGHDFVWVPSSNGQVPNGAVAAGHTEEDDSEPLYVGRANCNKWVIPGKVQPSHGVCYVPYDNREIGLKEYEILVVPDQNVLYSNPGSINCPRLIWPRDMNLGDDDDENDEMPD